MTMGCTDDDLTDRFLECVSAFNAYDPLIGRYLHPDVEIITVKQHTIYTPRQKVVDYLNAQYVKDQPHFEPNVGDASYHATVNGPKGTVRGVGFWIDNEVRPPAQPLRLPYEFEFVCVNNSWLLSKGRSL